MANKIIEKLKNPQLTNAITYVFNSMLISSNVKQFKVVFVNNVPLCLFFYRTFVFFFSVPKWLGEVCFPNNPPILQSICWIVTKSVHGRIQNPITYKKIHCRLKWIWCLLLGKRLGRNLCWYHITELSLECHYTSLENWPFWCSVPFWHIDLIKEFMLLKNVSEDPPNTALMTVWPWVAVECSLLGEPP